MDWHAWQDRMMGRSSGWDASPFQLPAPMAFFGMAVALMLGMLFGAMWGKKMAMVSMMGGKGVKGMHHHHGWGESPCMQKHHGMQQQAAPGADKDEERDEGE